MFTLCVDTVQAASSERVDAVHTTLIEIALWAGIGQASPGGYPFAILSGERYFRGHISEITA